MVMKRTVAKMWAPVKIDDTAPAKMVCKWHFLPVGNKQQRHGCVVGPHIEIIFRSRSQPFHGTIRATTWHW